MMNTASLKVATPTDLEILISREFNAPRRLVWEAWTKPEYLRQWLLGPEGWTMPVCEIDLRPGGTWRYVWRKTDGAELAMAGGYLEVAPPERLVSTERWGPEWPETVNTLVFTESEGRTTTTLTIAYPSKEARDAALKTGMTDGSEQSFARLDNVLASLV